MDKIDKMTMEYMSNKTYNEYVIKNKDEDDLQYEKEERFYKKRLYGIYKDLFKNKFDADKNVLHFFEKFNKTCIEYLKQKDTCDIVQKELGNKMNEKKVDFDSSVPLDCTEESIIEKNVDRDVEAFQNNNNVKTCTLDTYIIKKPIKKKDPIPPPQKIKVKLKTKELKNKDVNKKNINKKYDYGTKNIEETNKT